MIKSVLMMWELKRSNVWIFEKDQILKKKAAKSSIKMEGDRRKSKDEEIGFREAEDSSARKSNKFSEKFVWYAYGKYEKFQFW